jgi:hypothetical protein
VSITFTKLHSTIIASSIWNEDDDVRIVWVTMLAMAGADGVVRASVGGLAHQARKSVEATKHALTVLSSPDPDSTRKEHEGRRIIAVEGGWQLVNHAFYRELGMSEETKAYWREKQRIHREKAANKEQRQGLSKTSQRLSASASVSASASSSVPPEEIAEGRTGKTRPASEQDVIDFCIGLKLPRSDAEYVWNKWEGNGFTNHAKPMKDWQAVIRSHQKAGYLPSQKPSGTNLPSNRIEAAKGKYAHIGTTM